MSQQPTSWATGRPVTSPFALPSGLRGRLAGRFMQWTNRQEDVLDVVELGAGQHVLEVGYGPGRLIRALARRADVGLVYGIDPSPEMRDLAIRNNRDAVGSGKVRLGLGSAEATGLPSQSMDRVISVNNVAIWPDLDAGLREIHRVLRPDGLAAIAWHGGRSSSWLIRRLRLPEAKLARLEAVLRDTFPTVTRHRLADLDAFTTTLRTT